MFYVRDSRVNKPFCSYTDAHTEDITQIRFHPSEPNSVLSGSMDGLICMYDASLALVNNTDDLLTTVTNTELPIARFGFIGSAVYCITTMESLSFWQPEEAQLLHDFGDIRQAAPLQTDYVLDVMLAPSDTHACLITGNHQLRFRRLSLIGMF